MTQMLHGQRNLAVLRGVHWLLGKGGLGEDAKLSPLTKPLTGDNGRVRGSLQKGLEFCPALSSRVKAECSDVFVKEGNCWKVCFPFPIVGENNLILRHKNATAKILTSFTILFN